jgi:hypothetical protein
MVQQLEATNAGATIERIYCLQFDDIHRYSSRWILTLFGFLRQISRRFEGRLGVVCDNLECRPDSRYLRSLSAQDRNRSNFAEFSVRRSLCNRLYPKLHEISGQSVFRFEPG